MTFDPQIHPALHRRWRFSLRSLLVFTVLAALGFACWRAVGLLGAAWYVVLVATTMASLTIAEFVGRRGYVILAGALGGMLVMSIVGVVIGMLDAGVFFVSQALFFAAFGLMIGLVCGLFTRRGIGGAAVDDRLRRWGALYCGVLLIACVGVFALGRYVAWQRLMRPDFGTTRHGATSSGKVHTIEFWGKANGDYTLRNVLSHRLDNGYVPATSQLVVLCKYTSVTDAGLVPLESIPNLVKVDLRGTEVSARGAAHLRQRRPDVEVLY